MATVPRQRADRQRTGQTGRLDAEQIDQTAHAVDARPMMTKSAAASSGPEIFGRMPA